MSNTDNGTLSFVTPSLDTPEKLEESTYPFVEKPAPTDKGKDNSQQPTDGKKGDDAKPVDDKPGEKTPDEKPEEGKGDKGDNTPKDNPWESEDNPYKKRYNDSQREVQQNLLPKIESAKQLKERMDTLTKILGDEEVSKLLETKGLDVKKFQTDQEIEEKVNARIEEKRRQEAHEAQVVEYQTAIKDFVTANPGITVQEISTLQDAIVGFVGTGMTMNAAIAAAYNAAHPEIMEKKITARVLAEKQKNDLATSTSTSATGGGSSTKPASKYTDAQRQKAAMLGTTLEE